jgi:hypothetical protein
MPSGGCFGSGEVVPAILFASREKERAHEQLEIKRKQKHPLVRSFAHWNSAATEKAHGGGLGRSWRRTEELWRLGGLEKELGGALSSQECGEHGGVLNLTGEGSSTVNFEREARQDPSALDGENARRRPCWCLRERGSEPGASTSPGDAGKQAAACLHACARRCSRGGCAGQGAGDPYRITVATPIFPLFVPLRNSAKI